MSLLPGCEHHQQTAEEVMSRWHDDRVPAYKRPLAFCACCDGPAHAVFGEDGVGCLVLCPRCKDVDEAQALVIVTRIYGNYPDAAERAQREVERLRA